MDIGKIENDFLSFVNPLLRNEKGVAGKFPASDLFTALALTLGYLLMTLLLFILMKFVLKRNDDDEEFNSEKRKIESSVMKKISDEPILAFAAIYNAFQVLACGFIAYSAASVALRNGYFPVCNKFDVNDESMAKVQWMFYLTKMLDFIDTALIILRRKWTQLSFLHIYHHAMTLILSWLNLRAASDGDIYYSIVINASVHCIMYSYYNLTLLNIKVPAIIKKLVTNVQIIQFITILAQVGYLIANPQCPYPRRMSYISFAYIFSLLLLFLQFSSRTYGSQRKLKIK